MRTLIMAAGAALLAAGCSEEAPAPAEKETGSAALTPGLYQLSWSDVEIRATESGEPATSAAGGEQGASAAFAAQGCVAPDGTIPPAAFAEVGDECTPSSSYVRGGRIAMQLECRREGASGQVMQTVSGTTTAEGFEAEVSTTTYMAGAGDYQMTRKVSGSRVGECPAGGADATLENASETATGDSAG